jgi:hypothetical protein
VALRYGLDLQVMPKALRNSTFTDFLRQYGLDLHSVEYVSAEYRPGIQTHNASRYCNFHICLVYMTVTVCHSLGVLLRAGMSTLQQAAAFGGHAAQLAHIGRLASAGRGCRAMLRRHILQ